MDLTRNNCLVATDPNPVDDPNSGWVSRFRELVKEDIEEREEEQELEKVATISYELKIILRKRVVTGQIFALKVTMGAGLDHWSIYYQTWQAKQL